MPAVVCFKGVRAGRPQAGRDGGRAKTHGPGATAREHHCVSIAGLGWSAWCLQLDRFLEAELVYSDVYFLRYVFE